MFKNKFNWLKKPIYLLLIGFFVSPLSIGLERAYAAEPASHIVISEVQVAGGTTDDEFVELYNPTASPITMTDWRLSRKTAGGTLSILVSSLNGIVPAYGFFLITHPTNYDGVVTADVKYSSANAVANDNTVLLYSDAGVTLVDKVGMGTAGDFEGTATSNPAANSSIERKPGEASSTQGNGIDTNNNANDFATRAASEPQNSSSSENPNAPDAPTNVQAIDVSNDDGGIINLTWIKSDDDGANDNSVTGYAIYRRGTNGSYGAILNSVEKGVVTYNDRTANTGTKYFYKIEALDGAYSSFSSEVGPVASVDNLNPAISNLVPANGSTTSDNTPTISANFSDGAGIDTNYVNFKLDNNSVNPDSWTANGFSYTPVNSLSDAVHGVEVIVKDVNGNSTTATWSFTVSTTRPSSEITNPDGHTRLSEFNLEVQTSENTTGLYLYYNKDGKGWTRYGDLYAVANPNIRTYITFKSKDALGDGNYGFYTRAVDKNNNMEGEPTFPDLNVTVDTNPPARPVGYMVPGSPSMDNTPTAMGEISSDTYRVWLEITSHATGEKIIVNGSLIDNKRYEATPNTEQTLADGAYQIIAFAEDYLGNGSMYVIATDYVIDTIGAEVPIGLKAIGGDREVYLEWRSMEGVSNYLLKYRKAGEDYGEPMLILGQNNTQIIGLENGVEYEFAVASVDSAGNVSEYSTVKVLIKIGQVSTTDGAGAVPGQYPSGGPAIAPAVAKGPEVVAVPVEEKPVAPKTEEEVMKPEEKKEGEPAEITPIQPEEQEEGQVKAEETKTTRNWTRIIVAISILIIALGVGIGGWYGYQWLSERGKSETGLKGMDEKKDDKDKKDEGKPSEPSGRW